MKIFIIIKNKIFSYFLKMKTKTNKYLKKYKTIENGLSKHPIYFSIFRKKTNNERTEYEKNKSEINYVWVRLWDHKNYIRWISIDKKYMDYCPTKYYMIYNSSTGGFDSDLEKEYNKKLRYKKLQKINENN